MTVKIFFLLIMYKTLLHLKNIYIYITVMYKILQHYSYTITILTQLICIPKSLIFPH